MLVMGHQPNYLPYCGFFHKAACCDIFVIVDTVQFVKRGPFGWQHRNRIRTPGGWQWLTVPVLTSHRYHQKICEAEIMNDINWRRKHWQSIYLNYKKAKYFDRYSGFFEEVYRKDWLKLADLNIEIIRYLLKALRIDRPVLKCSELGIQSGGTQLIVDMCKRLGAGEYLSGIHGKDYLDRDLIGKNGLKIRFQNFKHPGYDQGYPDFIPGLSVIDTLFHGGDGAMEMIMENNKEANSYVER